MRREVIHYVFLGANKDDYDLVASQIESYGNLSRVHGHTEGYKKGLEKAANKLVLGLVSGAIVGALTTWGLIGLASIM